MRREREKHETRNPKPERRPRGVSGIELFDRRHFGFRPSGFFRVSVFGLRIFLVMRLGSVIGRVTLSVTVPALEGARWLIVSPFTREHFQRGVSAPTGLSKDPSLVVYDDLGGGMGQTIGFVEGREAACPFDQPTP